MNNQLVAILEVVNQCTQYFGGQISSDRLKVLNHS